MPAHWDMRAAHCAHHARSFLRAQACAPKGWTSWTTAPCGTQDALSRITAPVGLRTPQRYLPDAHSISTTIRSIIIHIPSGPARHATASASRRQPMALILELTIRARYNSSASQMPNRIGVPPGLTLVVIGIRWGNIRRTIRRLHAMRRAARTLAIAVNGQLTGTMKIDFAACCRPHIRQTACKRAETCAPATRLALQSHSWITFRLANAIWPSMTVSCPSRACASSSTFRLWAMASRHLRFKQRRL